MEDHPGANSAGERVAGMNALQHTSTVPRRVVLTVNGDSRLSHATPVAALSARPEVFTLLPKRFMTSSKRQVVRMSLSVIVGFVACWLPYFIISLVRIFTGYHVRLTGLLSAAELLALAHSALNPLIYGLFSARTLRQSCGQRCQRRRWSAACLGRTPSRWGTLPSCCCCGGQTVADMSPDAAVGLAVPPLLLSHDSAHLRQRQTAIELRDIALYVASTAAQSRRPDPRSDVRPTSADTSTTDTAADDACCHKSASAEFQLNLAAPHRPPRRRAHLQLTDHGTVVRMTVSADVAVDRQATVSDPIVRTVTMQPSTSC